MIPGCLSGAEARWYGSTLIALPTTETNMPQTTTCPECHQGDVISISMTVSGRDLSFSTCHACEAKWWHRDGEQVVLSQVIDTVVQT
jgi:DNA polymerase III alpha subunit (gram-positive type)